MNLREYALGDPGSFAAMRAAQGLAALGRLHARHLPQPAHAHDACCTSLLLAFGLVGLAAGLVARPAAAEHVGIAALLLLLTAMNAVLVSEARHNLTVMPIVVATGAGGGVPRRDRLRKRRAASPEREVAARASGVASGDVRGAPASPTAPR